MVRRRRMQDERMRELAERRAMLADLSVQVARFGYPPHEVAVRTSLVPEVSCYAMVVLGEEPFDLPRRGIRPLYCAHRPELDRAESVDPALRDFVGEHSIILSPSEPGRGGIRTRRARTAPWPTRCARILSGAP